MTTPRYTDDQKRQAVDLVIKHGLDHAHELLDGPHRRSLIRWTTNAGHDPVRPQDRAKTDQARRANHDRWEELRATMADRSGTVASRILDMCAAHLDELEPRNTRDLKDLATTAAILIDKAQLLDGHATSRHEMVEADRERLLDTARDRGLRLVSGQ